ncbi:adenosine 5'-monophosphoramidase HINT3 isoform X1 [Nothobranchius furzeri]|uniref:Histidine triad nucleotide binding protein 3 n=1 Tax=Nothobranchius furzeri TaxID=105023 RepID=A0A1A8AS50_NOTFU|nr:adenosine 5'-monophosphoramidase HINT3 [Nothobranchius furzeri]KAF7230590.1 histidine triad nucleotide-binding protein 3-like [Nothobranchius furzeri]
MANKDCVSGDDIDKTCIFCLVARGRDKETTVIKQNQELVCFRDIFPAAPYHFLVIPREHIVSCRSLNKKHISLVERMVELGRAVLLDQGITNMNDVRLGFHQFPFISVSHLHLHVLAPASQISQAMMFKFTPGSDSFITEESLRNRLRKKKKIDSCLGRQ